MSSKVTLEDVNKFCYTDFMAKFGNVVELSPAFAGAVWSARPFRNINHLHQTFCDSIDSLPDQVKEGVLRCLPDLAGRMVRQGRVSQESKEEQTKAGLLSLTDKQLKKISALNADYRKKFSIPFVVCARENKINTILDGLETRMHNEEGDELDTAIGELKKIFYYRISNLVETNQPSVQTSKL